MLIDDDQPALRAMQEVEPTQEAPDYEQVFASAGQKMAAAYATENIIGAALFNNIELSPLDEDYNPWDDMTQIERGDDSFRKVAMYANSTEDLNSIRDQEKREQEARGLLTGLDGIAYSIGAAVLDPINLIPVGGSAYKTYRNGGSILKGAAMTGMVAGGTVTAQEALLHSQQLERTYGESILNIGASAFLGGVLGSLGGVVSKKRMEILEKEIEEIVPMRSAGAMQTGADGDYKIKGKLAQALAQVTATAGRIVTFGVERGDPVTRTLLAKSRAARKLATELFEMPYDIDGIPDIAVESASKALRDALLYRGVREHDRIFREHLMDAGASRTDKIGESITQHRRKEFNELVAKEIRNPSPDADPRVKEAAESWQKNVYDPIKKDLEELGMLDEGIEVKTAQNYLNRIWNKDKIAANLPAFEKKVTDWLVSVGADPDQAPGIATEISGRLMSEPNQMLPYDYNIGDKATSFKDGATVKTKSELKGPLKERKFDIPDELIEEFLDNDIEMVATRYINALVPDIEIIRKFGDVNMSLDDVLRFDNEFKEIQQEYDELIRKEKNPSKIRKLQTERKNTMNDLQDMVARMRGQYGSADFDSPTARLTRAARNLNFVRFMGGVTISSIPDVGRIVASEGLYKAFSHSWDHLSASLSKGPNLAAEDVRYWGIGTDAYTGGRMEAISDINDYTLGGSRIERGLEFGTTKMNQVNLMNRWTGATKVIHAIGMQTNVMDQLVKGIVDPRLQRLGIDAVDAKMIREQVLKHGKKDGKAWIYNAKEWDDQSLAIKWYQAMKKENDRVIIVPGQEKPLFMSRTMGKTIFQFKSFMLSATQRIAIAGVQGQDAHVIQGLLAMTAMGSLTTIIKDADAGRESDLSPKAMIVEGIDRSGAVGIFMEINNTIEKISNNNVGIRPLFDITTPSSRYASRSLEESLGGPTYGSLVSTGSKIGAALTDDNDFTRSDLRAMRRLVPFQNLSLFRQGVDKIEEKVGDTLNLE